MILHLLFDSQFADYVIDRFSSNEMQSDFVLMSNTKKMFHFKNIDLVRIINPDDESEMCQLLQDLSSYKSIIFHGLFYSWQERLINRCTTYVKKAWVCWGAEIYGQNDIKLSFLKRISRIIYRYYLISHNNKKNDEIIFTKNLLNKIDYCITNLYPEYEYVKKYIGSEIKHISYNYYSIDETLGVLKDSKIKGNNIFIGNSATIENNHIETFLKLKKVGISKRKLIVPLSYGSPWVRNLCVKLGKILFRNKFTPLLEFIPREEYNAKMLDCSVMIQGHLREQAHGNIVTGLWLGMRVYLSEEGIDYKHFKSIGCKIFTIEKDLNKSNKYALLPLSIEDVEHNRKVLQSIYGKDAVLNNARELVKILNS